ncbi:aAA-ATPase [Alistipes sp. CAG:831]|nr:aAA-ATPase [Alistipes sp. CAG:831]
MVIAMRDGDTDRLKDILTAFLADIPYTARRKENERERERYFQYTFYLIFRLLGTYTVRAEHHSSRGRADCVVETPKYVYTLHGQTQGE